jgi:pimeloyl-ACP methyl ester carboxylesterase
MSMLFTWILIALLSAAVLGWLAAFWRRVYSFDPGYEQVHLVRTEDGWCIGLFRYPPENIRHHTPVILCHGLAANRYNFDLGPEKSLARYLQDRGFDVWVLELRGRGYSRKIGKKADRYLNPYVFDDYVTKDASAALDHIRGVTGASRVHWVGHSMGGLILYGLLQGPRAGEIASGVAVASPGDFRNVRRIPGVLPLWSLGRFLPRIHQRFLAAVFAPVFPWLPASILGLVYNPANVDRILILRAVCHLISDVSRGEMLQFYDVMRKREFRSFDGKHSYQEGFAGMNRPLLLMAGTRDPLCPPKSIAAIHEAIRSPDKELRILGKEYGQREEYGHGDLLIGKHCETEVYPHILRWLEQGGTAAPPGPASRVEEG